MTPRANRDRAGEDEKRRAMYEREAKDRAAMLHRLGSSAGRAERRLRDNLDWEFEIGAGGRPKGLSDSDLAKLVKAAFKR